jgi:hypothetical protein
MVEGLVLLVVDLQLLWTGSLVYCHHWTSRLYLGVEFQVAKGHYLGGNCSSRCSFCALVFAQWTQVDNGTIVYFVGIY